MIVAIHQPNFIPWIGFFYKIYKADIFVLLDDAQYIKNSYINRNQIKTPKGKEWLTLPVIHSGKFGQKINQVEFFNSFTYLRKIKGTLTVNYSKSTYFKEVFDLIESSMIESERLATFNESLIKKICKYLGMDKEVINSSGLSTIKGVSTERLIEICKTLQATEYLAGFGSKKYQDNLKFKEFGINPIVYDFVHPVYDQLWGEFIPNLSIVDLLFNHGKNSIKYLSKQ